MYFASLRFNDYMEAIVPDRRIWSKNLSSTLRRLEDEKIKRHEQVLSWKIVLQRILQWNEFYYLAKALS